MERMYLLAVRRFIIARMTTSLDRVRRVKAKGAALQKFNAVRARKTIARVVALKKRVEESFYEMGKLIKPLKAAAMFGALGYETFAALCDAELGISDDQADRLIDIVDHFTPKLATTVGNWKATALVELSRALGKQVTPATLLQREHVAFGNHQVINVRTATANRILQAARSLRDKKPAAGRRGVHVTAEEKALVNRLVRELDDRKVKAKITSVAGGKVKGGKLKLEVNVHDARALGLALTAAAKS